MLRTLVMSAAALVAAAACSDDNGEATDATGPPTTAPESTTTTATATTTAPQGTTTTAPETGPVVRAPGTAAVAAAAGVAVVEMESGEILVDLVSQELSGRAAGFGAVAVARGGEKVYLVAVIGPHRQEVHAVEVGGPGEMLAVGADVAVSPDGRRMAYSEKVAVEGRAGSRRETLVVRDLATGEERRWENAAPTDPGLAADLGSLSWAPDSRHLAFHVRYEDGVEVRVLDTTAGASVLDGREVEPPERTAFAFPAYGGDTGRFVVVAQRGGPDPAIAPEEFAVVEVDQATGAVGDTLAEPDRPVTGLDFDASGHHLLVVTRHDDHRKGGRNGLLRLSGDRLVEVPVDREPVAAAW